MNSPMEVECLVDRVWDVSLQAFSGLWVPGQLLEVSSQGDAKGNIQPVGIVVLSSGVFLSVPVEFLRKSNTQ